MNKRQLSTVGLASVLLEIQRQKDVVVIEKQAEQRKEVYVRESWRPEKGHKCFELNPAIPHVDHDAWINDIVEVKPVKDLIIGEQPQRMPGFRVPLKGAGVAGKITQKEGHLYVWALNKKNAVKKFKKYFEKMLKNSGA